MLSMKFNVLLFPRFINQTKIKLKIINAPKINKIIILHSIYLSSFLFIIGCFGINQLLQNLNQTFPNDLELHLDVIKYFFTFALLIYLFIQF